MPNAVAEVPEAQNGHLAAIFVTFDTQVDIDFVEVARCFEIEVLGLVAVDALGVGILEAPVVYDLDCVVPFLLFLHQLCEIAPDVFVIFKHPA